MLIGLASVLATLFANQIVLHMLYPQLLDTTASQMALEVRENNAERVGKLHGIAGAQATVEEAERTIDDQKRAALYGDAQRILAEDVPALYLFVLPKLGIWNAKLHGLWENAPIPSNDVTEAYWTE